MLTAREDAGETKFALSSFEMVEGIEQRLLTPDQSGVKLNPASTNEFFVESLLLRISLVSQPLSGYFENLII